MYIDLLICYFLWIFDCAEKYLVILKYLKIFVYYMRKRLVKYIILVQAKKCNFDLFALLHIQAG